MRQYQETSCFTPRLINKEMRETGGERAELCPISDFMLQSTPEGTSECDYQETEFFTEAV